MMRSPPSATGPRLIFNAVFAKDPACSIITLSVGCAGILTICPLFRTLPIVFLDETAPAGGIALINSLGDLSGFVSSYLIGFLRDLTHSTSISMYMLGGATPAMVCPDGLAQRELTLPGIGPALMPKHARSSTSAETPPTNLEWRS